MRVLRAPRSILIIRPSALGDVARSVPVLASVRAAYPEARIDWLVREAFAPVIAAHPGLSNVVIFPRRELGRWAASLQWGKVLQFFSQLRAPGYDLVIDCQGLARSAWLGFATGSRRRVGHRDARELGWLPLTQRVRTSARMHTVDKMLALVEACGITALRTPAAARLYCAEADRAWWARERAARLGARGAGQYAVLAPTSAWPAKEWPQERFAALAAHLAKRGVVVVLVAGPSERARLGQLTALAAAEGAIVDMMGGTGVGQLMAIVEGAGLVVANDSAALHIGVGFGRPLVALLGPTDPELACPYGREADVVQHVEAGDAFYFRDDRSAGMIQRISLDEVVARAEARLEL